MLGFGKAKAARAELERLEALRIRPAITGVDGRGELIASSSRPVYTFAAQRLTDVDGPTRARDDELVRALMALEAN